MVQFFFNHSHFNFSSAWEELSGRVLEFRSRGHWEPLVCVLEHYPQLSTGSTQETFRHDLKSVD